MLDFLLVLGQVPGTNIQITFSEILLGVAALFLYRWERANHKKLVRNFKHYRNRAIINSRKAKRQTRWFIRRQERKLQLAMKRAARRTQRKLNRTQKLILNFFYTRKRRAIRAIKLYSRRTRRYIHAATIGRALRWRRNAMRTLRRTRRQSLELLAKRQRRLHQQFSSRITRIKKTRIANGFTLF